MTEQNAGVHFILYSLRELPSASTVSTQSLSTFLNYYWMKEGFTTESKNLQVLKVQLFLMGRGDKISQLSCMLNCFMFQSISIAAT